MEKEEALRDIHEIKQVMEESQRRTRRGKYWIGLALALVAIVIISGLIPYLGPVFGIGLIVGGVIAWRRSDDSFMKAIAAAIIAVGIVLTLATLFVIFGLMAFTVVTDTMTSPGSLPMPTTPSPSS
jgi:Mg2+/citrate symporter